MAQKQMAPTARGDCKVCDHQEVVKQLQGQMGSHQMMGKMGMGSGSMMTPATGAYAAPSPQIMPQHMEE